MIPTKKQMREMVRSPLFARVKVATLGVVTRLGADELAISTRPFGRHRSRAHRDR
jgi:hypothetical protein